MMIVLTVETAFHNTAFLKILSEVILKQRSFKKKFFTMVFVIILFYF